MSFCPRFFNQRVADKSKRFDAEPINGPSINGLSEIAKEKNIWVLAGSICESDNNKLFNTSVLINNTGRLQKIYRKLHLFDVEVDGEVVMESKWFKSGEDPVIAPVEDLTLGMSICYDLRFPELYRTYSAQKVDMISVPSSFTTPTGKIHWEVLLRARAIENQCFVLAPNQVGPGANHIDTYGNSMIVGPQGEILVRGSEDKEEVLIADLDFKGLNKLRSSFPVLDHRVIV